MISLLMTSSALIVVIALARLLLRKKVSQRLTYSLWLLVALRLLIPFEIGQSAYSLAAVSQPAAQQVQQTVTKPVSGPDREALYQSLLQEYIAGRPELEAEMPIPSEVQTQLRQEAEKQAAPTLSQLLKTGWLAGVVLMALWFLTTNLVFFCKSRKNSIPWGKKDKVPIRVCPHIPSPCLVGVFRPTICLTPDNVQDETALSHILAHEMTHFRHLDPLWSLVRCLCLCIYWFNPLVWMAALLSKQDCELACDEAALGALGEDARIPYGKTLMTVIIHSRSPIHMLDMATSMSESKGQLKERMRLIVKKPKTMMTAAAALMLIAVLVTGCAFLGSKPSDTSGSESTTPNSSSTSTNSTVPSTPADPLAYLTESLQGYWVNLRTARPLGYDPMRYCYEYMWMDGTELGFGLTYSDGAGQGTVTEVKQLSTSTFAVTRYTPESGMDTEDPTPEYTSYYTFTLTENTVTVTHGQYTYAYVYMCQSQGSTDATRTHIESMLSQIVPSDPVTFFGWLLEGYWVDTGTVEALPDHPGQYAYQYMYISGNQVGFGKTYCDCIEEIVTVTKVEDYGEGWYVVTCSTPEYTRTYDFDIYGETLSISCTADGQTLRSSYKYMCPDQGSAAATHTYIESLLQALSE